MIDEINTKCAPYSYLRQGDAWYHEESQTLYVNPVDLSLGKWSSDRVLQFVKDWPNRKIPDSVREFREAVDACQQAINRAEADPKSVLYRGPQAPQESVATPAELERYGRELEKCLERGQEYWIKSELRAIHDLAAGKPGGCDGLKAILDNDKPLFQRVGSVDLCIKHRFRGTAEQPGCPECKTAGDGFFIENPDGWKPTPDGKGWMVPVTWTIEPIPYRTCMVTGISGELPKSGGNGKWDDTTEPSAPTKRSDDPVPAWLRSEAPEATSTACGCFTHNGVTLQCLACAKGGA